jgi:hypothetical protein
MCRGGDWSKHTRPGVAFFGFWVALILASPAGAQSFPERTESRGQSDVRLESGTDIGGAIADSMKLLMLEHGTRIIFQEKTRRELSGPFFGDYGRSVRVPSQWGDTDSWQVNYIGHPIHGAAAGMIWLDHGPDRDVPVGFDGKYFSSRARAMAFSAIYSLQFEIGPLSEASIGNVGMRPETTGWVDHVITPAGAFVMMMAEDAVDRYVMQWIERRTSNRAVRGSLRILFNPSRALANAAQGRAPWQRPDRTLGGK